MEENNTQNTPVENNTQNTSVENNEPSKVLSIVALVLGIVSCTIGLCCYLNFLTVPAGLVVSIIAIIKCNKGEADGKIMAQAGLGLCIFSIIIWWTLFFIGFGIGMTDALMNM